MMIVAIAVSTMVAVAVVVFAVEMHMYRKNHVKPEQDRARQTAETGQEARLTT